jgi:hypothetical protein
MLTARMATSSSSEQVRLRDVSASGARIEAANLLPLGTCVLLTRGTFTAYGQLVWRNGTSGGVRFDEPLDEETILDALNGLSPAPAPAEPYRRAGLNRSGHSPDSDGSGWVELLGPARGR